MKVAGFDEICLDGGGGRLRRGLLRVRQERGLQVDLFALDPELAGGVFPFEFGGETVTGPASIGVGLEEAEVTDRGLAEVVERAESMHGVDRPAGVGGFVATPIEWRLPAFGAVGGP